MSGLFNLILCVQYSLASKHLLRSVGGRDANQGEFPFVVRMEAQRVHFAGNESLDTFVLLCTGSVLKETWTLTAAHCLDFVLNDMSSDNRLFNYFFRYNHFFPKIVGNVSEILNVYRHPRYCLENFNFVRYDIAIVQTKPIIVSLFAKLSAMDYTTLVGYEVFLVGHGATNLTEDPPPLQVINGILAHCKPALRDSKYSIMSGLCVRALCGIKAALTRGDSGGPVVHISGIVGLNTMTVMKHGVIPHTSILTFIKYPYQAPSGIVTMLSPALNWITSLIQINNEPSKKTFKTN